MDKYDKVLDMTDHPEKYSAEETARLMADPEIKEIYEALSLTASGANASAPIPGEDEIMREWHRLEAAAESRRPAPVLTLGARMLRFVQSRAAVIGAVALTSAGALAVGIGMHYSKLSDRRNPAEAPAVAEVRVAEAIDTLVLADDAAAVARGETIVFENETLAVILGRISAAHGGLRVVIADPDKARLRLYFRWNTSESLAEVMDHLNHFEQIEVVIDGNTIKAN